MEYIVKHTIKSKIKWKILTGLIIFESRCTYRCLYYAVLPPFVIMKNRVAAPELVPPTHLLVHCLCYFLLLRDCDFQLFYDFVPFLFRYWILLQEIDIFPCEDLTFSCLWGRIVGLVVTIFASFLQDRSFVPCPSHSYDK
jgi:hypothetical protein